MSSPTSWTDAGAPRIWRSPKSDFLGDEPLSAGAVYTDAELKQIAAEGFNGVWLRGRLYDLMRSEILPELNRPEADKRVNELRALIERGKRNGVGVWLFFNEPLALPAEHEIWKTHPEIRGTSYIEPFENRPVASLCMSTPLVKRFFSQAVSTLLADLPGLAGVILITASEHHSHCWSHYVRFPLGDIYTKKSEQPVECPRCREREPSGIVLDLIQAWRDAAKKLDAPPKVLAWNWSWSLWYREPQSPITAHLPEGVELLLDFERGGSRQWRGQTITIDEYSLSYAGPSDRFLKSAQETNSPAVHVKLQLGATHELASVPNMPLLPNLHTKLVEMCRHQVAGVMGCWNFGCLLTLNTFAFNHFARDPNRCGDRKVYLTDVAYKYFGDVNANSLIDAWDFFCQSWYQYPFCFGMLYHGPTNYAPGFPLKLDYQAQPLGPSWLSHIWGELMEDCIDQFRLDDVIDAFADALSHWKRGLALYRAELSASTADNEHARHRREELSCAEMIQCHLRSTHNLLRWHRWRQQKLGHHGAGTLPPSALDDVANAILADERESTSNAIALVKLDSRLGYHQEAHAYLFGKDELHRKAAEIDQLLSHEKVRT